MKNIKIMAGSEGIKQAYTGLFNAQKLDIVCLSEHYDSIIGDWMDSDFLPKLKTNFTRTREILPDTAANRNDAKTKDPQVNMVRFLKTTGDSESDMILTESTATLVSFDPADPGAVMISDPQIVASLKMQFEELWNCL